MIIWIDQNNEVVSVAQGVLEELAQADNVTSFCVDALAIHGKNETLHFNPETHTFYTQERKPVDAADREARVKRLALRKSAERQRDSILKWFSDNDWKVNKHTLGEWSNEDPRWLAYLSERKTKREEYDAASALLLSPAR